MTNVTNLPSLRTLSPLASSKKSASARAAASRPSQRSFFDAAPVRTVADGRAFLRKLQKTHANEDDESAAAAAAQSHAAAPAFGVGATFQNDGFGIYGAASMVPRVYQASGFDPYLEERSKSEEEDALQTASNPHVAWRQLDEWGLAMFMHLYARNLRRLLACHVKDVVEAFIQNATELNACGVLADVLLRRLPTQALLSPPGQTNQMTNVSLADMLRSLTKSPLFVSKTRGVNLFEEHTSVRGDMCGTDGLVGCLAVRDRRPDAQWLCCPTVRQVPERRRPKQRRVLVARAAAVCARASDHALEGPEPRPVPLEQGLGVEG